MDLKLIRRDIGQITLAAGMTDDTIGWILPLWCLVYPVAHLTSLQSSSVGSAILGVAFTVGRTVSEPGFAVGGRLYRRGNGCLSTLLILSLAAALTTTWAWRPCAFAWYSGRPTVALAAKPATPGNRDRRLLAPIFFAAAGLKVNLLEVLVPDVDDWPACPRCRPVGKFTGAYIGSRVGGLSHWEGLAMGSGMRCAARWRLSLRPSVSRWGTEPADVLDYCHGSNCNLVDGPTPLRWTLSKVEMGEEEVQRLQQEEQASQLY